MHARFRRNSYIWRWCTRPRGSRDREVAGSNHKFVIAPIPALGSSKTGCGLHLIFANQSYLRLPSKHACSTGHGKGSYGRVMAAYRLLGFARTLPVPARFWHECTGPVRPSSERKFFSLIFANPSSSRLEESNPDGRPDVN